MCGRRFAALAFVLVFVFALFGKGWASPEELAEIQKMIKEYGLEWTAKETWVSKLPPEQRARMLGGWIYEEQEHPDAYKAPKGEKLPSHFDWRDYEGGDWMTRPKNQGYCGACAAFAAIGAFEAVINIANGNPNLDLDLSEQHLFSCGRGYCDRGMTQEQAMDYLKNYGVPLESCFPYTAGMSGVDVPCSDTCSDWQSQARKIDYWNYVSNDINSIKSAIYNHGPLVTAIWACDDWTYYGGGIYSHPGDCGGCTPHGIVLVGWDDAGQYWIVKNSWGTAWGEGGYIRIKWGTCGIDGSSYNAPWNFNPIYLAYTPNPNDTDDDDDNSSDDDDSSGGGVCEKVCDKLRYCDLIGDDTSDARCMDWCANDISDSLRGCIYYADTCSELESCFDDGSSGGDDDDSDPLSDFMDLAGCSYAGGAVGAGVAGLLVVLALVLGLSLKGRGK